MAARIARRRRAQLRARTARATAAAMTAELDPAACAELARLTTMVDRFAGAQAERLDALLLSAVDRAIGLCRLDRGMQRLELEIRTANDAPAGVTAEIGEDSVVRRIEDLRARTRRNARQRARALRADLDACSQIIRLVYEQALLLDLPEPGLGAALDEAVADAELMDEAMNEVTRLLLGEGAPALRVVRPTHNCADSLSCLPSRCCYPEQWCSKQNDSLSSFAR